MTKIGKEHIYNTAMLAGRFLATKLQLDKKVLCLGNEGLVTEIQNAGFPNAFMLPTETARMTDTEFANFIIDPQIAAVVKAPCMRFDFRKICIASLSL